MVSLIDCFISGDMDQALQLHEELLPLCQSMFFETNPIPVKTALNLLGNNAGSLRLPLVPMAQHNKERLISVLKEYNFSIKE
jgi:4-hydroxy-tetrahydrodipicolinate synthase